MSTHVKPIPTGYEGATPYLCCKDAASAIEFYIKAFGATEVMRMAMPGGKLGHAEIKIGQATIMMADEFPEMGWTSPQTLGGSPVSVLIYVEDVDAVVDRSVAAGVKVLSPAADQFYGDRNCKVSDPFGHVGMFATRKENLTPEEQLKRAAALFGPK